MALAEWVGGEEDKLSGSLEESRTVQFWELPGILAIIRAQVSKSTHLLSLGAPKIKVDVKGHISFCYFYIDLKKKMLLRYGWFTMLC